MGRTSRSYIKLPSPTAYSFNSALQNLNAVMPNYTYVIKRTNVKSVNIVYDCHLLLLSHRGVKQNILFQL